MVDQEASAVTEAVTEVTEAADLQVATAHPVPAAQVVQADTQEVFYSNMF